MNLVFRPAFEQRGEHRELQRGQIVLAAFIEKHRHRDLLAAAHQVTGSGSQVLEDIALGRPVSRGL